MSTDPKTFLIPNELCQKAGIAAACAPVNQFTVFPWQPKAMFNGNQHSGFHPRDASVFNVRQDVVLFNDVLRRLINQSNGIFLNLQPLALSKNTDRAELMQISLQYRSVIRECLENLQKEISNSEGSRKEELQSFVTIFYSVECIWHLCEILFIDSPSGNIVLPHFLSWIQFHFPKYEQKASELISGNLIGLESNPDYWETVRGALLQGRVEIARALLKLHSNSRSSDFELMDSILESLPTYSLLTRLSNSEFNLRWKHWTVETEAKIEARLFVSDKNLDFIARMVIGDESAWSEIRGQCETWYELLGGQLFYMDPMVKSYKIGKHAKACISTMGVRDKMKHLDQVILAAVEGDVLQVLKETQHMTENGWFATHLTDLLYHSGCLDVLESSNQSEQLRESFLLDYGTLLMGHQSLWQVGLSYLDFCPTEGLNTISLLLERIPLTTETKTMKIIREASKRDLNAISQSVCKIQGKISLRRGRTGNALAWALKAQDANFASYLADQLLREYTKKGEFQNLDLLDTLGTGMVVSDRLMFLGKYREFHRLYSDRRFKEAGELLVSLVSSRMTPKYFSMTLLLDAVPLLESDSIIFSSNDSFALMHFLEEKSNASDSKDKVEMVRLALARNLARALTFENQL